MIEKRQAVRNIREVRGFGAEGLELSRFKAATRESSVTSAKIGVQAAHLEALNRASINARCDHGGYPWGGGEREWEGSFISGWRITKDPKKGGGYVRFMTHIS